MTENLPFEFLDNGFDVSYNVDPSDVVKWDDFVFSMGPFHSNDFIYTVQLG